jgi:hypothetical protein
MTVTNGVCSDTRKKAIEISPNPFNLRNAALFNGIEFVNIYPNPNTGSMNVEVKTNNVADINIQIINMQGAIVDNLTVKSSSFKSQLDFGDLASGLYYMKFQVGEDMRILKMVKL